MGPVQGKNSSDRALSFFCKKYSPKAHPKRQRLFRGGQIPLSKRGILLLAAGLILLTGSIFSVMNWLKAEGDMAGANDKVRRIETKVNPKELDEVLAEDLASTASLFIRQISKQLETWATKEGTNLPPHLARQVEEHPHFAGAAWVQGKKIVYKTKGIEEQELARLSLNQDQEGAIYSDPYLINKNPYMLIAWPKGQDQWLIGKVDLGFIKGFIGEMAHVADSKGHFFVGGEDPKAKIKKGGDATDAVQKRVPEVGWTIQVQSDKRKSPALKEHYRQGEVVVRFRSDRQREDWLASHPDFSVVKHFQGVFVLRHPSLSTEEMIKRLKADPAVAHVEPNAIFTKQGGGAEKLPNDEFFRDFQWNLTQIGAEKGWNISAGRDDLIIAILDTGVDEDHPDLADKLVEGYNAIDGSDNVEDEHGHGTHVAGIASAVTNNLSGIAGVSWQNKLMPVKVLNQDGEGGLYELINGIYWATDHGADVINLSLGDEEPSELLHEAIRYAYEHDVVLVAASGNDHVDIPIYPAAYPEVLAVSAVNQKKEITSFSNYGPYIDVAAPGEHIPGTFTDNQYVFMSGTSMAAPHVTGLVALIRSRWPQLTNEEVMNLIRQTAEDLGERGYDPYYGYGLINVYQALDHLAQGKPILHMDKHSFSSESEGEKGKPGLLAELQEWLMKFIP